MSVKFFNSRKELEEYKKRTIEKEKQKQREWEKKTNKECFQRWLKDFKITYPQWKKLVGQEGEEALLEETTFFIDFYYDPFIDYITEDGTIVLGGKKKTPKEREEIMASFFGKIVEIEAKKYSKFYNLDWEDLRQDFEIELIKKRGTYDLKKGANLLTYYKLLMRHKAIEIKRSQSKRKVVSLDKIDPETGEPLIEIPVFPKSEEILDLELALMKLPLLQKKVIELVYLEELTGKMASKQMGITQQAINKMEKRGLKNLKRLLTA